MKALIISKELTLPIVATTEKLAWLGTTGSGKTYGASKLAEEFWENGAQFITIDPVGVWYGLRLAEDGRSPSEIDIPIFGGLHGDVPLEPTGGEFLANLIVDNGLSCIIDVSQFESDTEKARFAGDFANRFFFRKKASPSAVHLFLEECQEFVPQNPQRGEERMLHAFVRMQKLGRNFGIGSSYITQRPQEVNKKALNMAQTLFVFRTTGTHERTAIEKWIEDKSLDQSIAQDLPKIPTGTCHVWSPEFLKISNTVRIAKKKTFNASATPEVGAKAKARQLAPIDLEKVRVEMAATIEKAKADDPKELKKLLAKSNEQVKTLTSKLEMASGPKPLQVMGVSQWKQYGIKYGYWEFFEDEIRKDFRRFKDHLFRVLTGRKKEVEALSGQLDDILHQLREEATTGVAKIFNVHKGDIRESMHPRPSSLDKSHVEPTRDGVSLQLARHDPGFAKRTEARFAPSSESVEPGEIVLKAGARKMLEVIVARHPMKMTKSQFATLCGMSHKSSTFDQYLAVLRRAGFIDVRDGIYTATDLGIESSGSVKPTPQTPDQVREMWRQNLKAGAAQILDCLVNSEYPSTREQIAEAVGMSFTSSTFDQYLAILKRNGLIIKTDEGYKASDIFY